MQNAESQRRAEGMKKWGLNAHVYFARGLDGTGWGWKTEGSHGQVFGSQCDVTNERGGGRISSKAACRRVETNKKKLEA